VDSLWEVNVLKGERLVRKKGWTAQGAHLYSENEAEEDEDR